MLQLDIKLFHFTNGTLSCAFFDWLMPAMTEQRAWIPIIIGALILLAIFGGRRGIIAALTLLIAIAVVDPVVAKIFKPWVGRIRPCHAIESVRLIWSCGGKFSFPSNHAANCAAMAAVMGFFYPKWLWVFVPIASIVGFSRIYIGVHYPLDVLAGFVFGAIVGIAVAVAMTRILMKKKTKTNPVKSINGKATDDESSIGKNNHTE